MSTLKNENRCKLTKRFSINASLQEPEILKNISGKQQNCTRLTWQKKAIINRNTIPVIGKRERNVGVIVVLKILS